MAATMKRRYRCCSAERCLVTLREERVDLAVPLDDRVVELRVHLARVQAERQRRGDLRSAQTGPDRQDREPSAPSSAAGVAEQQREQSPQPRRRLRQVDHVELADADRGRRGPASLESEIGELVGEAPGAPEHDHGSLLACVLDDLDERARSSTDYDEHGRLSVRDLLHQA